MAAPLHSPGSTSCLHARAAVSQPSFSCTTKALAGLKPQSASLFANGGPNSTADFYHKVSKSLSFGCSNQKPRRARVTMMATWTPLVPYKMPRQKNRQWIDLWNAFTNVSGLFWDLYTAALKPKSSLAAHAYRERIIFVSQRIDEDYSNQILATLLYLDTVDSSESLHMYINGSGGDLTPCLAIYDTMQSLKTPIHTLCLGHAVNMAALLIMAGDKGNRTALPLSRFEMWPPAGAARGLADDVRNETDELIRIKEYIYKEVARNTGQPLEKVHKDLSCMKRWSAQEAVEYGIIDRVLRPPRIDIEP